MAVQAGSYKVSYPSVASPSLTGEEAVRPLSQVAKLVRRVHSGTQTQTLGIGTARMATVATPAQTQTDASLLDGMVNSMLSTRLAMSSASPQPSRQSVDAVTAEAIMEVLNAEKHWTPSTKSIVCNGSSAAPPRPSSSPPPRTSPTKMNSAAARSAARPSRPSTASATSLGRVYPSSLTAGIAASVTFASLPRTSSASHLGAAAAPGSAVCWYSAGDSAAPSPVVMPPPADWPERERPATAQQSRSSLISNNRSGSGGSLTTAQLQKARFKGPLPMVRLVQGFSQSATPRRLHSIESEADLERQLQLLGLPPATRWVPNPHPVASGSSDPSPGSSTKASRQASRPQSAMREPATGSDLGSVQAQTSRVGSQVGSRPGTAKVSPSAMRAPATVKE